MIKTSDVINHLIRIIRKNTASSRFPQKGIPLFLIKLQLWLLSKRANNELPRGGINYFWQSPPDSAINAYTYLLKHAPNNIDVSTEKSNSGNYTIQQLESILVDWLKNLYSVRQSTTGYITSGATEGNIFSAYLARQFFYGKGIRKIVIISTILTHYSIVKAARLLELPIEMVSIDPETFGMEKKSVVSKIRQYYRRGYRGFIIPFTHGYNTGGSDDIDGLTGEISRLQRDLRFESFCWIDAALTCFTAPILMKNLNVFQNKYIKTIVGDFYKFLGVPQPSGFILYNASLSSFLNISTIYPSIIDNTLLGSRSGLPAAACWSLISNLGKSELKRRVKKLYNNKLFFIEQLKLLPYKLKIVTSTHHLTLGCVFLDLPNYSLPKTIEKKFDLLKTSKIHIPINGNNEEIYAPIYRFHFFQNTKPTQVEQFFNELQTLKYQSK